MIRIGIVGYGRWGRVIEAAINRHSDFELDHITSSNEKEHALWKPIHESVLTTNCDAHWICVPISEIDEAVELFSFSKTAMLIEKPGPTKLIHFKQPVQVGYTRVFDTRNNLIPIDSYVSAVINWEKPTQGNLLENLGSHDIARLLYIAGTSGHYKVGGIVNEDNVDVSIIAHDHFSLRLKIKRTEHTQQESRIFTVGHNVFSMKGTMFEKLGTSIVDIKQDMLHNQLDNFRDHIVGKNHIDTLTISSEVRRILMQLEMLR